MHASAPAPAASPAADGQLRWDGVQWSWLGDGVPHTGCPQVIWDFGAAMLLRWRGAGPRWLWVSRRQAPAGWHGLRVALMHAATR